MDSLLSKIVNTLTGDKALAAHGGKDYWIDDAKVKACYECEAPFNVFNRRHHCRICGRIFCSNCTLNSIPPPRDAADQAWMRVCNYCHRMRQRDDDVNDRAQFEAADKLFLGSVHGTAAASRLNLNDGVLGEMAADEQKSPKSKAQNGNPVSRGSAISDGALTWEVPSTLDRTFGPTSEAVAETAPLPAETLVPALLQAAETRKDATADTSGAVEATNGSVSGASNGINGAAAPAGAAATANTSTISTGLHPLVQLNRQEFAVVADKHVQLLLWQLLQAEAVEQPDLWMPIILQLVNEASRALLPAAAAAYGQQDPRFYVKVKRLPDMGHPSDSRVVQGVVAKKNVAHRRMRTDIQQPCVALLSGALEYQRVANKLSSFDTLLEQEREHLRLAVARIAAAKPDLLMVERSVARSAQEELLAQGISLVQHTKPELLDRLSRCMGIKVAASVEELSPQVVGTCSRFHVEPLPVASTQPQQQQQQQQVASEATATAQHLTAAPGALGNGTTAATNGTEAPPNHLASAVVTAGGGGTPVPSAAAAVSAGTVLPPPAAPQAARPGMAKPLPVSSTPTAAKTLMIFDGCPLPLGCTVLLWGASAAELTKLKRIVKFGVLAAYHQGLECAFLAEELALGTAALAVPGLSQDVSLFRSLARAAIGSSADATNPEHLPASSRLLLSLSPHVVIPDALEKEQQHAAAVRLYQQQQHASVAYYRHSPTPKQQQQEQQVELLLDAEEVAPKSEGIIEDSNGHIASRSPPVQDSSWPAFAATGAAVFEDQLEADIPGTPGSSASATQQQQLQAQLYEPEFTDPLRRRTYAEDSDDLLSGDEAAVDPEQSGQGLDAVPQVAPLRLQGLQLYDRQHVYLSMACRNPRRGLLCEPPAIKRIDYYCHSDLSLAAFIVAAAPHAQKKCQAAGCGDGVTCHVRTFLHAGSRITLSIATLPAYAALPGEDRGQVWMWMRPKGTREHAGSSQAGVRMLPLSQVCACMSFGMFLSLCFNAPGLEVFGTPLHSGFVRYFGLGRSVMCLHQDTIYPSSVVVPRMKIAYSLNAQLIWLKQEAAELCQESNEAFDVLETALQSHPYFRSQAAAAVAAASPAASTAASQQPAVTPQAAANASDAPIEAALLQRSARTTAEGDDGVDTDEAVAAAAADVSASAALASALPALPAAAAGGDVGNLPLVSLSAMLSAIRKDRSSFVDRVGEVVQRATCETPEDEHQGGPSAAGSSSMSWDEQLMAGILDLNRLQRSLAITTLTWAATLQEPALFTQMLAATSSAGPAAVTAAAAATASAVAVPGSPLGNAAAAAAIAAVSELSENGSGSTHGGSMFHMPAAVAAQRMGISDGADAGDQAMGSSGMSVPIMPNAGPIAVQAVAHLVASQAAAVAAAGGLLEGSQQVMMAVTKRAAPDAAGGSTTPGSAAVRAARKTGSFDEALEYIASNSSGSSSGRISQHTRSSSTGTPVSPRARWSAAAAAATAQAGNAARKLAGSLSIGTRGSTGTLNTLAAAADSSILSSSLDSTGIRVGETTSAPELDSNGDSPAASYHSASSQSRQQQQQHRRGASGTGSLGASAAAVGSADDGSSDDGEVAHDRFVAWMTSHEIVTPETDDMSDHYPEQLPDWEDGVPVAPAGAGAEEGSDGNAAVAEGAQSVATTPDNAASIRPSTPPATLDQGARTAAASAAAAAAAPGHRRVGSTEAAASGASGVSSELAPIKTSAGRSSSIATATTGTVGLQQIARVALPGRALMPAGINDTVVPIFDAEPTSIAAYFLSSRAYQLQLNAAMKQILHGEQQPGVQQGRQQQGGSSSGDGLGSSGGAAAAGYQPLPTAAGPVSVSSSLQGSRGASQEAGTSRSLTTSSADEAAAVTSVGRVENDPLGVVPNTRDKTAGAAAAGDGPNGVNTASAASSTTAAASSGRAATAAQQQRQRLVRGPKQPDWLALLLSPEPLHVKHAFEDDSPGMPWLRARFSVTAYFAPQFAELRRRCVAGGEAAFITSLCRCRKWASRGGKSNAYFAKTRDDRFIVKSLSKPEKASFLEFAPAYFEHMAHASASGKPTALAKVAGVYSISIRSQSGNPIGGQGPAGQSGPYKDGTIDVLVMENIFYDRQISRIYDLKGSERSRFNADAAANPQDVGAVHLDDNLRRATLQQPILVHQGMLRAMERALWSDTSFLAGLGVMDYSLLVGVDREHNQLVVAIIDFIRTYTWDKQLETWVKSSGILGGNGKEPTIVSPKQYMRRFRTAISSYFTVVPDGHEVEPPLDADAV